MKLSSSRFSRRSLALFALAFGIIGYLIFRAFAAPNPNLPGDLNADNTVNVTDLSILLSNYGTTSTNADINSDGTVNVLDMSILLSHYGQSISSNLAVNFASPTNGSTVSGTVHWEATITAGTAAKIEFYVDNVLKTTELESPYCNLGDSVCALDTTSLSNGSHTLKVIAADSLGTAATYSVTVTVSNTATNGIIKGLGTIRHGTSYLSGTNLDKMAYVEVGPGDASLAAKLPGTSTFYTSASQAVYDPTDTDWDCGVRYVDAKANGWLLHDSAGNEIVYLFGGNGRLTNPGIKAFQDKWATNMIARLQSTGADGVMIDNFGVEPPQNGDTSWNIKEIANQQAFQAAMLSFIQNVGTTLKAKGYYVMVNGSAYIPTNNDSDNGNLSVAWVNQIAPYISGYLIEYWQENGANFQLRGLGPEWYNHWDGWQAVMAATQAKGIDFHGEIEAGSTDLQQDRYVRGSFLLEWNGGGGSFMAAAKDNTANWNTVLAIDPGQPTGAKYQIATNIWRRDYNAAAVVVNPTAASVTVNVNGTNRTIAPLDAYIGP